MNASTLLSLYYQLKLWDKHSATPDYCTRPAWHRISQHCTRLYQAQCQNGTSGEFEPASFSKVSRAVPHVDSRVDLLFFRAWQPRPII